MKFNKQKLKAIGFAHFKKQDCDCFKKDYKDFSLFVAEAPNGRTITSIKAGKREINIPEIKSMDWVEKFDKDNS